MKKTHQVKHEKDLTLKKQFKSFPDFLIIGPHRTGTTWLYSNLNLHPQIFFPCQKEVHFFCEHKNLRPSVLRDSDDLKIYLDLFREPTLAFTKKIAKTLIQYKQLYRPIKGEATACYAILDRNKIEKIIDLNPNLKVIMMVRNPVVRAWSHARHFFIKQKNRQLSEVPDKELDQFFRSKYLFDAGKYTEVSKKWKEFVREENFFIGLFDDIEKSPDKLLLDIFNFLEVFDYSKFISEQAKKKINSVQHIEIPERYLKLLNEMFKDEFSRLESELGVSCNSLKI